MKKFLLLLLLTAGFAHGQSNVFSLGSRGKITIYISEKWTFESSDFGDRQMISVKPRDETNAKMDLNISYPDKDRFDTKARLKQAVEVDGMRAAEGSVEGRAIAKAFVLGAGYGYHVDFTDPKLVGKPPKKDDFKTGSFGLIRLAPDVVIEISILADGFNSAAYNELLGAIEGMEYSPGRGR
ncbi:MAG: hypothetical protein RLZZ15_2981 [Verrucomicrobiota bacterium]